SNHKNTFLYCCVAENRYLHSFPTRRSSDLLVSGTAQSVSFSASGLPTGATAAFSPASCSPACSSTLTVTTSASTPTGSSTITVRSEEHTSELQSRGHLVCRLLLENKNTKNN